MSKSKAYRATNVNEVRIEELAQVAAGRAASVGMDIGKHEIFSVVRWENGEFERPWKVKNPAEIPLLAERLRSLAEHCAVKVAMEPTGTYGDPLRAELGRRGLPLHRVGGRSRRRRAVGQVGPLLGARRRKA